jgi:hypothetical protein
VWRSKQARKDSAVRRLRQAAEWWNWKPHAGQRAFFVSDAQVRVAACGRRWGKTEALGVEIATLALDELAHGRPCQQLIVAPTEAQARLIGLETQRRLQTLPETYPEDTDKPSLKIRQRPALQLTLTSPQKGLNAQMTFQTAGRDGRGLRGLWAHRILVDEAGYVPDAVLEEVLMPMLADVGGELVLASSPSGRRSAYYRCFARGQSEGPSSDRHGIAYQSFQCPSTQNTHLDKAWLRSLRDDLGESRYAQEVLAQFVDDYGAVFRADDIEACLAEDPSVSLVDADLVSVPIVDHWYSVGVDWGRKRDFTVVAVLDGTERSVGQPARLVGLWRMQGTGWEAQAQRVGQIVAPFHPLRILADGNSLGDPMAERLAVELRRVIADGERVPVLERFVFAGESKQRLVDHLTLGLSARSLTYPHHRALLSELRGFEYGRETSGGRHRMAARGSGHDDIVMALALAWYSVPEGPPPPPSAILLVSSGL